MASPKLMASNNSDLSSRRSATSSSSPPQPLPLSDRSHFTASAMAVHGRASDPPPEPKSVEDVWREIVSGDVKEEAHDEMMTLEDFLARAGAAEEEEENDAKERLSGGGFAFDLIPQSSFPAVDKVESSVIGFRNGGGGRGKRARPDLEPLDRAAQQRQRRMIKNRESAARSRERKQAYQVELESLTVKLEEEKEMLLKGKAERTKKRLQQLMEKVIPVTEKQRPARVLRRVRSLQW